MKLVKSFRVNRLPIFLKIVLLKLSLGTLVFSQVGERPVISSSQVPFLRYALPVDSIIAGMENHIPEYMRRENIPGVAVALIRDSAIVWTGGFGVVNTITAKPVTPGTLFEVASNSKLVTAYIALRLVDQGRLSLDGPLNSYLSDPWLPPSEYRDVITLRHVLSHSSGLGHLTFSRNNFFAPGKGYSYSNKGFLFLQAVIEQLTGQTLEDVARQMVFQPLGMSSSSFINHAAMTSRTANGHVHAIMPVLLFAVPYLIALVIVAFIGILILRIWKGYWRPDRRMVLAAVTITCGLVLLTMFILLGKWGLLKFAWLISFCGITMVIAFASAFVVMRKIIQSLFKNRIKYQNAQIILWSVVTLIGIILLASKMTNMPVPKWPAVPAGAASSLRATAGDMATFLIELSDPKHLCIDLTTQLRSPQVRLSDDISWGLGPGIQHSQFGDALWQWGQNIDFQSVLIVYPDYGFGVVVLTNNDLHNPDVAIEIAHIILGGPIDQIRRASHLEFNYTEEN
jgi:CubicO group peptidase (beta-lactamase class C family)